MGETFTWFQGKLGMQSLHILLSVDFSVLEGHMVKYQWNVNEV